MARMIAWHKFRVPPSEERGNSHEENLVGRTIVAFILGAKDHLCIAEGLFALEMSMVEKLATVSNHS